MRTGVRIERSDPAVESSVRKRRGTPTPSGGHSPRPFGPRGECTTRNCAAPTCFGTPMSHACGDAVSAAQWDAGTARPPRTRRAGIRTTSTATTDLLVALADRRLTRGSVGCRTWSPQRSDHRRNARHWTARSSALRRGPRPLFGALRRAGPRPHPHRSATCGEHRLEPRRHGERVPRMPLPHAGVRCGTHRSRGVAQGPRGSGSPRCPRWSTNRLGAARRTRRSEVIHIPR